MRKVGSYKCSEKHRDQQDAKLNQTTSYKQPLYVIHSSGMKVKEHLE